jgi:hypothetical protein
LTDFRGSRSLILTELFVCALEAFFVFFIVLSVSFSLLPDRVNLDSPDAVRHLFKAARFHSSGGAGG